MQATRLFGMRWIALNFESAQGVGDRQRWPEMEKRGIVMVDARANETVLVYFHVEHFGLLGMRVKGSGELVRNSDG